MVGSGLLLPGQIRLLVGELGFNYLFVAKKLININSFKNRKGYIYIYIYIMLYRVFESMAI